MTGSTPSDLAVTFRSVDRRLREALDGIARDRPCGRRPGRRSCVPPSRPRPRPWASQAGGDDLAATANAVAGRIDRVPTDEWDDAHLESLRAAALEVGRVLRAIAGADRARRLDLRRQPPLRFGWLLLAALGSASGHAAVRPAVH